MQPELWNARKIIEDAEMSELTGQKWPRPCGNFAQGWAAGGSHHPQALVEGLRRMGEQVTSSCAGEK